MTSDQRKYFVGLHGRGWKRWQLDRLFNLKPWFLPRFFWIRFMRAVLHKRHHAIRHFAVGKR